MLALENNLGVHHYVYQDDFYNGVKCEGKMCLEYVSRAYSTMKTKRGISKGLDEATEELRRRG